jgi:HK97 family phage major capsid protein
MTIKELRQKKHDLKKSALDMISAAGEKEFTAEEQTKYDGIKAEMEKYDRLIKREEERMDLEREASGAAFDQRRANGGVSVHDRSEDDPSGGFRDHRDFLGAVMQFATGERIDTRLRRFSARGFVATQGSDEHSVLSDPNGGFLVPVSVMPGVLTVTAEQDPLKDRVTNIPMRSPIVVINARVDKDHTSSVSGGLVVTRRPELIDGSASRMSFEPINMDARDLFGGAFASENILNDSPESFLAILAAGFGDEFANNSIRERLSGNGNGEFLGVLNAPCTVSVAKETNQAAVSIVKENIDKMAARCWRYGSAVYLANHTTRPQLRSLSQAVGTGGAPVPYFTQVGDQEYLDGRPIFFTEHCEAVGTVGDLVLGNWSEYLEGEYQPMQYAESIHVRFMANQRAFKFWKRNCGQPWWKAVLQPKKGVTLAPFITLATRA